MKAFEARVSNGKSWISTGAISREFLVFSEDFVSAVMESTEELEQLRKGLVSNGIPADKADIILVSVCEKADVTGKTAAKLLGQSSDGLLRDHWASETARKIALEMT